MYRWYIFIDADEVGGVIGEDGGKFGREQEGVREFGYTYVGKGT